MHTTPAESGVIEFKIDEVTIAMSLLMKKARLNETCPRVWFVAHTSSVKKLVAYYILVYVWFVAKILAANRYIFISLIDSC
jgi:hypothetical protein